LGFKILHRLTGDEIKFVAVFSGLQDVCSAESITFKVTVKGIRWSHFHMC